jgi:hypothetical protein
MLIPSEHDDEEIMPAFTKVVPAQLSHKELMKLAISRVGKQMLYPNGSSYTADEYILCCLMFIPCIARRNKNN